MIARYRHGFAAALACAAALVASLASAEITYENGVSRAAGNDRSASGTRQADNQQRDWHHADEQGRDLRHERRSEQRKTRPLETVPRDRYSRRRPEGEFRDGYRHGYNNGFGDGRRNSRGYPAPPGVYLPAPGYGYSDPGYGEWRHPDYGQNAPYVEQRRNFRGNFGGSQNGVYITPGYPRNIDNNPTYRRNYPADR